MLNKYFATKFSKRIIFAVFIFSCIFTQMYFVSQVSAGGDNNSTQSTNSKNNTNNNANTNSDPNITNEERKKLANCDGSKDPSVCLKDNPIVNYVLLAINFLTVGVGVVVTIMIIVGGIQYTSAGANPQAIQAAKQKIYNAIIALIAYFFLFGFLQWLVPGGIF